MPALAVQSVLLRIHRLGLSEQPGHLLLQLASLLLHPAVTHRLVLRRVRPNLRPVERHVPQPRQPSLSAQLQHLHEQLAQRRQVPLPELRDRVVIRMLIRRQNAECQRAIRRLLDLPRTRNPDAVAVQQQTRHHSRIIRRLPALRPVVRIVNRRQVQRRNHVLDKIHQIILRQPILHVRRQQEQLIRHIRTEYS